jgi:hypothetical protein
MAQACNRLRCMLHSMLGRFMLSRTFAQLHSLPHWLTLKDSPHRCRIYNTLGSAVMAGDVVSIATVPSICCTFNEVAYVCIQRKSTSKVRSRLSLIPRSAKNADLHEKTILNCAQSECHGALAQNRGGKKKWIWEDDRSHFQVVDVWHS